VQRRILDHFAAHGVVADHPPIVAVGPHSGDPHFETCAANDVPVAAGDFARDLPSGHVIGAGDIVMKSPGGGIPPYDLDKVIGRVTLRPLVEDDFLTFEVLSKPDAELARS